MGMLGKVDPTNPHISAWHNTKRYVIGVVWESLVVEYFLQTSGLFPYISMLNWFLQQLSFFAIAQQRNMNNDACVSIICVIV